MMATPHGIPDRMPGQRWAIINRTLGGKFIVEGFATLSRLCEDGERWLVRFDGETERVARFLDEAAQSDPAQYVRMLNAQTRS